VEQPIITAAGAYTHPAPPGKGSEITREHLQSDSSKPKAPAKSAEETGKFEGDWNESASQQQHETYKFEPEQGEIASNDKGILWGVVGAATLWGVFGPGKKKDKK
jgi:hypothetical protein